MNEDLFNKILRRGMQTGDVPLELTDGEVDHWLNEETPELPDSIQSKIKKNLKLRLQDAAIQRSVESLNEPVTPLGQLILTVRERAGVSRSDISECLGKPDEYLRQIEEDDADFPKSTAEEFARVMEILHLRFSKVSEAIYRTWGFTNASGWPDAVASGLRNGKDEGHSKTGAALPWRKARELNIPSEMKKAAEAWLVNLQSELRKRNRTDLLD